MSVLIELDRIRDQLSAPGQPFELVDAEVSGTTLRIYKNLPPNLTHLVVEALAHSERTFLVSGERRLTYAQALGQAAGFAHILRERYGIGPGTRVAIAGRNSVEWILAFFAILLTGATATLVNSRGAPDEMIHAIQDTECALLIADPKRARTIGELFRGPIIVADPSGAFRDKDGATLAIEPGPVRVAEVGPDDPAIIMFTSGTTGRPKGAVLTHRGVGMFLFGMRHNGAAQLIRAAGKMGMEPKALAARMPQIGTLAIYPLFHVSGASAMLMGAVINGGKIVFMDRWDAGKAFELIASERITMLQGPPAVHWDILAHPERGKADLSSITNFGIGGQATPPNLLQAILQAFPNAAPGGGYGQTETNGAIASGTGEEYLANPKGSGRILPGTEVRIVDENGNDQPPGGIGEIWVKSPLVMAGYWNQPEANAAVFSNGWLRTGDIGWVDEHRFIVVVDRKKDVIIRGGENIYCAELERVYQEFPGVLEVAAFGVPDERLGEEVVLAAVAQPGAALDANDLRAYGRERLADYKIPSEFVFAPEPFVRNAVGKIDKAVLRRSYAERH